MGRKVKKSKGASVLKFEGDLSVSQAGELKDTLLEAFDNSGEVEVDMRGVTGIDVSCMQVFLSAHKSAGAMKKTLRLCGLSDQAKQMIKEYGCDLDKAAGEKCGKVCFYIS